MLDRMKRFDMMAHWGLFVSLSFAAVIISAFSFRYGNSTATFWFGLIAWASGTASGFMFHKHRRNLRRGNFRR